MKIRVTPTEIPNETIVHGQAVQVENYGVAVAFSECTCQFLQGVQRDGRIVIAVEHRTELRALPGAGMHKKDRLTH